MFIQISQVKLYSTKGCSNNWRFININRNELILFADQCFSKEWKSASWLNSIKKNGIHITDAFLGWSRFIQRITDVFHFIIQLTFEASRMRQRVGWADLPGLSLFIGALKCFTIPASSSIQAAID
jgi:hypothetical protein